MTLLNFSSFGLWTNLGVFAAAAGLVWAAGSRLASYVDAIADRTGLGQAFAGALLLGGMTSLPEIAAVSTSAYTGNAALATNNLLGSVSINIVLIALADAVLGRDAITSVIGKPTTLLQGVLLVIALAMAAAATVTGDVMVGFLGAWSIGLALYCGAAFWLASRYSTRAPWQTPEHEGRLGKAHPDKGAEAYRRSLQDLSLPRLIGQTALAALVILVAGFCLSQAGDAIAKATGLGAGLVGLVLVGFATSLPEASSIVAAVRLRRYEMALGDVFGTNILTLALIALADGIYRGGPVLNEAGSFETVAALLGLTLTANFLVGLLERENRTVGRMGYDALGALAIFGAGLVLLYRIQSGT